MTDRETLEKARALAKSAPENDDWMSGEDAVGLLFAAVKEGQTDVVQSRINKGTDINQTDASGMTVLHHAVALGARACIRALVNCGRCDYLIRDNLGRYASDIAIEWSRDFAVARLLSKHQARQAHARGVLPFETD